MLYPTELPVVGVRDSTDSQERIGAVAAKRSGTWMCRTTRDLLIRHQLLYRLS